MKLFGRIRVRPRLVIGVLAVLFLVFVVGFWRISKSPKFCLTCHYMRPYYEAWQASSHNDVLCVECHYEPGLKAQLKGELAGISQVVKYVTRTFSPKPKAEISDAACLRPGCHETRLLSGQVMFKENIIFDHANHLGEARRGMKLRCTTCHSQIVQGPHIVVTESSCFTCHFFGHEEGKTVGTCLSCHGPPAATVEHQGVEFDHSTYVTPETDCLSCHTNVTQGSGEVPPERCFSCHVQRSERWEDAPFLHEMHVTEHKVECFECHVEITHGVEGEGLSPLLTLRCLDCHSNQHSVAEQMYSGVGVEGLPNSPSRMFLAKVNCNGCHKEPEQLKADDAVFETAGAAAKECVACHGEGYDEMMDMWQEMMRSRERLASITKKR
jgi:nitrate/TMAO reductase-like tetraheme cytochrome c subunit